MRCDEDGAHPVLLANTGGRPLGISVGDKGVFVADARRGLLQIKADGSVVVLSTGADGKAVKLLSCQGRKAKRSEEHTSELQSLMRLSYAVFCLKKNKRHRARMSEKTGRNDTHWHTFNTDTL